MVCNCGGRSGAVAYKVTLPGGVVRLAETEEQARALVKENNGGVWRVMIGEAAERLIGEATKDGAVDSAG